MNRQELIEEIKNYVGSNPHESIQDYINEAPDEELHFFHWCLENEWHWYDSDDSFIQPQTRQHFSRKQLMKIYNKKEIA